MSPPSAPDSAASPSASPDAAARHQAGPASPAPSISDRRQHFRALHREGCFVLPNPWDVGSARALEQLGFLALATTSSGMAWSQARPDGGLAVTAVLEHLRTLVAGTRLPINADFENGFAADAQGVADNVGLAIGTGIAGLSIEDATGDPARPLYDIAEAVDRLAAARSSIAASGTDTVLVGRAEGFLHGQSNLDEIVARLQAYAEAGADCLYAPGINDPARVRVLVAAVAPRPLNVLVGSAAPVSVAELAALGVRRISVGGALARAAWGGFLRAAAGLAEGNFAGFADAASGAELNGRFRNG